jgi:hypothetical protein
MVASRNFWTISPKLYENINMWFILAVSKSIVNKDKDLFVEKCYIFCKCFIFGQVRIHRERSKVYRIDSSALN